MTKGIRYAIAIINEDIDLRAVDNFKLEFYTSFPSFGFFDNQTDMFVAACTIDNKLDFHMVNTYMDEAAKKHLFNILYYWCGIGHEVAEKIVNL